MRRLFLIMIVVGVIGIAAPVLSGLLGDVANVTVVRDGNQLQFVIIDELYANKGIVNTSDDDRFIFEAYADFYNASTEDFIASTGAQDFGIEPDADADLRKGSTVGVMPLSLSLAFVAGAVEAVLNGGDSVDYDVTVSLVLVDGAGTRHYLDSMTIIGVIVPEVVAEPSIEPTRGPVRTPFTITDPQGRMVGASLIVFFEQGQGPEDGIPVTDPQFSVDGITATGTVPTSLAPSTYFVTVHPGSVSEPPVFNALVFIVTA